MKSLHDLAPIPSLSDFRTVYVLYTQFSTSQCWNQQPPTQFPIESSPHLHQLQSTTNPNLKFPKSSIPRLTIDIMPANYSTLSIGLVTKALMKKLPRSSLLNLDMPQNLFPISTRHTWPNLALCQIFLKGFELPVFSIFIKDCTYNFYVQVDLNFLISTSCPSTSEFSSSPLSSLTSSA